MHQPAMRVKLVLGLVLGLVVAGCTSAPTTIPAPAQPTPLPSTAAPIAPAPTAPAATVAPAATLAATPTDAVLPSPEPTALPTDAPSPAPTATPACSGPLTPTVSNAEGPYYTPDAPFRSNLLDEGIAGTRLVVTGRVLTADCQPVAGALLDFWQADGNGEYDNAGYRLRGRQEAAADGSYRLETVLPGEYPGRPPHIHVKVQAPGGPALTTQIYFEGMPGNASDRLVHESLITSLATEADGSFSAPFDFVLAE